MQDLNCYGVREFTHLASAVDSYVEELCINGFDQDLWLTNGDHASSRNKSNLPE